MSLQEYRRKRNFRKTSEPDDKPKAKARRQGSKAHEPIFVVQEHHASHLHYDFRLEAFGTLKSWAVPKGPSTQPGDKRLAVEVEDHPIGYANFSGRIPEGEYGAGVVKIWDKGVWVPPENLKAMLAKGHLEFELKGKKLKGRWMLIRTQKTNQWLLIKRSDRAEPAKTAQEKRLKAGEKTPMPDVKDSSPQLAQLSSSVPEGPDWIFETKFDGYRTLVRKENARTLSFHTRSGLDWSSKYEQLTSAFKKLKAKNFIIDGEIVVEDEKGRSRFSLLQQALESGANEGLVFQAFDLLYLDGKDLREEPLEVRKQILKDLLKSGSSKAFSQVLKFSEHIRGLGEEAYKAACKQGLEGILAKDRTSSYRGKRSDAWQKIKCTNRQEVVIGGYTEPRGSRQGLGALLVGVNSDKGLTYAGKVGTGFDSKTLGDLRERLEDITIEDSPFAQGSPPKGAHFVRPNLVAEVEFTEWTDDGHLRHPVFLGLRQDKKARDVIHEKPKMTRKKPATTRQKATQKKSGKRGKGGADDFRITHPERVVYPADQVTKLDVANYYRSVAPWILPHIADRPIAMVRCPERAGSHCFFQKHVDIERMNALRETMIRDQKTVSTDSAEGLLQLAQWGVLEIHTWQNHNDSEEHPDQFIVDLDPDDKVGFAEVRKTAFRVRDLLNELDLKSFVKVTGGKGLHIHVPIRPDYEWDAIKNFVKSVGQQLSDDHPGEYTTKMSKEGRKGKIFIDYLRNGFGATAVAPYSLRSKEHASIAVPITWDELKAMRTLRTFGPDETLKRLAKMKKDVWPGYFKLKQEIALLKTPSRKSSRKAAGR